MDELTLLLQNAKLAARELATASEGEKNAALLQMACALENNAESILSANALDVADSKEKLGAVMIDRLTLNKARIAGMAKGIREVVALEDPVGITVEQHFRPNGLKIEKRTVPLGVLAIIYESRPNVTADAAALSLKSGNVCVLKGGKEAFRTAKEIVRVLREAVASVGLNPNSINMPEDASRAAAQTLMTANDYVDALIPRGGAGLIRYCVENASVPCIQTGTGICHVYVDKDADEEKALNIVENAKTSRPSVCNAEEVLLVHEKIAPTFLPKLYERLVSNRKEQGLTPVELRLCENSAKIISGVSASEKDFDTEFLSYILAVKIVSDVNEAITHIADHSTHHSESIVTENDTVAEEFLLRVDSAAVYHNASTRFTDGGEFGQGCEIGISTQKLHARGPMGLRELTSYKYVVRGNGQIR
ncbi:MAG: glutamate-5-semialdehyde dehydrogenase [Clostridiales bacterium]|nr:glutamate-5-semialdehyde dehydrogenase [Clostridiales bacterium]